MSGFTIEKRGYSLDPWRIVSPGGDELTRSEVVHVHGKDELLQVAGHPTKTAAVEALGVYAWKLHEHIAKQVRP